MYRDATASPNYANIITFCLFYLHNKMRKLYYGRKKVHFYFTATVIVDERVNYGKQ